MQIEKQLEALREKVDYFYERIQEFKWANEGDIGTIFGKDKHAMKRKVKKKGVIALESWIYLAEELIKVLEDREQHKIDAWLIRANTKIKK